MAEALLRARIKELEAALTPFVRAYRFNEPISATWPDEKPAADCIPGLWPIWADLKRAGRAMEGKRLP